MKSIEIFWEAEFELRRLELPYKRPAVREDGTFAFRGGMIGPFRDVIDGVFVLELKGRLER